MQASLRNHARWLLPMTVLVAVGGCSDRSRLSPPDVLVDPGKLARSSGCDANRVAHAVGQLPTPELLEAARSGAGAQEVRTLAHGDQVSSRYRAQRLNLVLDTEGRVGSVNCG